jgi:hypothetical protein
MTAELQLREGQLSAAAYTLSDLPPSVADRSEQENLTFARLMLAQDQPQTAQSVLETLEQNAQRQGRSGSLVSIYVLQALVEQALNQFTIRDPLREAIVLGAQLGFRRTFLNDLEALAPQIARRRHVAPEFVEPNAN